MTKPIADGIKPTKPVAYLHVMQTDCDEKQRRLSFSSESAFGVPGRDHSETWLVTTTPLYAL